MKNKVIIFLLFIFSLACSSADYAEFFNVDYEPTLPSTPLLQEGKKSAAAVRVTTQATDTIPTMQVCTGVEDGHLRVRSNPGTTGAVLSLLEDGQLVFPNEEISEEESADGATWIKITDPEEGWVNKKYICETYQ